MASAEAPARALPAPPPSQLCQAFFLLSAALVAGLYALPATARRALLDYGARRPASSPPASPPGALERLLAGVTSRGQVPHSWFLHFYVLSASWSAFWAWQFLARGGAMGALARMQDRGAGGPSVELGRVVVAWGMMALQGARRLYESLYVSKPGKSPMWFVHWALGLVYYTSMGISVWIEGSGAILESWASPHTVNILTPRAAVALSLCIFAWWKQYDCHKHLASLEKYTLPTQSWFKYIVCPHYTCECLIYLCIASVAAPPGSLFNRSVLCGLLFVAVNLGATAHGTKQWYADKFGADKVAGRWNMIPLLF